MLRDRGVGFATLTHAAHECRTHEFGDSVLFERLRLAASHPTPKRAFSHAA